jgi:hypothetical protein
MGLCWLIRIEYHERRYPRLPNGELIEYVGFEYLNVMFHRLFTYSCVLKTVWHWMVGWWMTMNWNRLGRKQSCLNGDTILAFTWRDWGKSLKTSVRIANAPVEIWTKYLWNTPLDCYLLTNFCNRIWTKYGHKLRVSPNKRFKQNMQICNPIRWNRTGLQHWDSPIRIIIQSFCFYANDKRIK